eukprot:scaffold232911_cov19-Tisochrysis_lutea.AAC.1
MSCPCAVIKGYQAISGREMLRRLRQQRKSCRSRHGCCAQDQARGTFCYLAEQKWLKRVGSKVGVVKARLSRTGNSFGCVGGRASVLKTCLCCPGTVPAVAPCPCYVCATL